MRVAAGLAIVVTLAAGAAAAQTPAVSGRVVDAGGQPVPYARVRIDDAPVAVRASVDGNFTIAARAGTTLIVTKSGYARTTHKVDASRATDIALAKAAVIAGRMTDSTGEPIAGATVRVIPAEGATSQRLTAITDDRGEYRVGSLGAGSYIVAVDTVGAEFVPTRLLIPAGANVPPEMLAAAAGWKETTNTTFFPGTPDRTAAAVIRLQAGEQFPASLVVPFERAWRQPTVIPTALPPRIDTRTDGDARVEGTIMDSQGQPLAHAVATLDGTAVSVLNNPVFQISEGTVFRTAVTDDRGHYEFTGVRAGAYSVRASKTGYTTPPSALTSFAPLTPLQAGKTLVANLTLAPMAVISGRVRDEFGDPVEGAHVALLRAAYERGRRRLTQMRAAEATTDDRGDFRISTSYAGDVLVAASVPDASAGDVFGYARTFYPGTLAADESRTVGAAGGGEVTGIDISLVAAPTTRIAGQVIDASGQPTNKAKLTLISRSGLASTVEPHTNDGGTFEFSNVAPGQYVLQADVGRSTTFTEGAFVALPVSVGGADIIGLQVQLQPGSTITGRFVYDRFNRAVDPPPTAATIAAIPADFDLAPASTASSQANAEGVFQLRNVTGARRLQVTRVPPRYMVKAILVGGRDVTDEALTFGRPEESVDDVEVVLTDRISELTGTVTGANARPVDRATVVLFSTDRQKWYSGSRFLRTLTTNAMGTFATSGVPFGTYFAAVVRALPPGEAAWQDPAFLDSIVDTSIVTAVGEGRNDPLALRAR